MYIVALFDRGTLVVVGVHDLGGKLLAEGVVLGVGSFVGKLDQPADRDGELATGRNRHRDLVSCPTNAAGADFGFGFDIGKGSHQNVEGLGPGFVGDDIHAFINLFLGHDFFTVLHDTVDEFGNFKGVVFNIPFEFFDGG